MLLFILSVCAFIFLRGLMLPLYPIHAGDQKYFLFACSFSPMKTNKIPSANLQFGPFQPQMCLHWLTQCFWNYLDWTEICHYISTCVILGPDYQVYMCVAIFKHLQPDILQKTQSQELQVFLKVRLNMEICFAISLKKGGGVIVEAACLSNNVQ